MERIVGKIKVIFRLEFWLTIEPLIQEISCIDFPAEPQTQLNLLLGVHCDVNATIFTETRPSEATAGWSNREGCALRGGF